MSGVRFGRPRPTGYPTDRRPPVGAVGRKPVPMIPARSGRAAYFLGVIRSRRVVKQRRVHHPFPVWCTVPAGAGPTGEWLRPSKWRLEESSVIAGDATSDQTRASSGFGQRSRCTSLLSGTRSPLPNKNRECSGRSEPFLISEAESGKPAMVHQLSQPSSPQTAIVLSHLTQRAFIGREGQVVPTIPHEAELPILACVTPFT